MIQYLLNCPFTSAPSGDQLCRLTRLGSGTKLLIETPLLTCIWVANRKANLDNAYALSSSDNMQILKQNSLALFRIARSLPTFEYVDGKYDIYIYYKQSDIQTDIQ